MSAIHEIEKAAQALPVEQRVLLAESLLRSLPPLGDQWSEVEEMNAVERREREIEHGQVLTLNDAEFWNRVEARRKR